MIESCDYDEADRSSADNRARPFALTSRPMFALLAGSVFSGRARLGALAPAGLFRGCAPCDSRSGTARIATDLPSLLSIFRARK
jgi:hypothetical protein